MRRLAIAFSALAVVGTAVMVTAWHHHENTPAAATVPISAGDVLGRAEKPDAVRLVTFLATQPDTAAGQSRSQAVEIVSLLTQYESKGLTAEIVDESGGDARSLTNTYYDWQLGGVHLVADPDRTLAKRYGVTSTPTTLLLDRSGIVVARWNTYTPTAQTAAEVSTAVH